MVWGPLWRTPGVPCGYTLSPSLLLALSPALKERLVARRERETEREREREWERETERGRNRVRERERDSADSHAHRHAHTLSFSCQPCRVFFTNGTTLTLSDIISPPFAFIFSLLPREPRDSGRGEYRNVVLLPVFSLGR